MTDGLAVQAFAALAQETRLAIYRRLVEAGPMGLPAGALAEALEVPAPTLSFHLAQLRGAGLITQRRSSRSLIYAVDVGRMTDVIAFLSDRCCSGQPELCLPSTRTRTDARPRRKAV
ncbi:MAG: metalloregulator ArsR/SmtB family transcription factor [Ferrovibrio sp.]|uniref:ArsR/SmtB family transcription factor n=1 Tax=Ferrovibrio sp. TaxID=1917215 RepID=UPI0026320071|nr:metalloregulator ArsR/SmtB family transcription factor [Ferrovibrio sp.]MCW0232167.1 metalloregulator ArsR/SmtB family transcription factor [Ferrovibrio sp.]